MPLGEIYSLSADLFQSSSVLAYSCNPPMPSHPNKHTTAIPQYLAILTSIQASEHLSIHGCMDPFLHHLRGAALGCHRGFAGADPLGPDSGKSAEIDAAAWTGMPNSSFGHPGYSSGAQVATGPFSRHQRWSKASEM